MTRPWLIAIDDTDNLESVGTGKLARWLAAGLNEIGLIEAHTVTRHQLLVHPDVPYTSHNSSACIATRAESDAGDAIFEAAQAFLLEHEHAGANPGLCVLEADAVPALLPEIGRRAQSEVLDLAGFDAEIAGLGLRVWSRGETGQGRIGAVCGVGLRSTGEDGRFIDLAGIRQVGGRATVDEILALTGVDRVVDEAGHDLQGSEKIETRDWIRPELRGGCAVFSVRRDEGEWVPAARRSKDDG
jgi:hypothetical protein